MYRAVAEHLGGCEPRRSAPLRFVGKARISRARALRRGALRLRIDGLDQRTRATFAATTTRGLRVAFHRTTIAPGPSRSISVPLTAAGRTWLRRHQTTRLVLRARGAGRDTSRRVTVR